LLFLLLGVNALLTPMNGLRLGSFMSLSDVLLVAAAPVVMARQLLSPAATFTQRFRPFLTALGVIILGGLIAAFVSSDSQAGIPDLIRFTLSTVGVLLLVAAWAPSRREVRVLAWALSLGAATSALVGLARLSSIGRPAGLATHPNHLGMTSMLSLGTAFGLAMTSKGLQRKVAGVLSILLVAGLLVSGSRAALFGALVMALTFLVVTHNGRTIRWYLSLCAPLLCAVLLGVVHLPTTNAFTRLFGDDPSAAASNRDRAEARAESFDQIRARPITGSGFNFSRTAHSLYLQLWVSAGLLGLFGLLALLLLTIGVLLLGARAHDPLLVGMAASYLGYLAAGVATNILWDRYVWLHLALTMALAALASSRVRMTDGDTAANINRVRIFSSDVTLRSG
ncbi:MAG: O-antigen ligase family protein, partial [Actinomycetota bacterium]|nr:O-antigen ligase family protein [Actinomycetota bacterium]